MKKACILGPVDKRMLVYPLIKVLDLMGKTLIVSDDSNFRRFSEDLGTEFTVGRVDFIILTKVNEDVLEQRGFKLNSYDYIVFVTTNELFPGCDKVVYCHGLNKSMCTEDVYDDIKNKEFIEVIITTDMVKEKDKIKFDVSKETLSYVWSCEEVKVFEVCKSKSIQKVVSELFSDLVGVSKEDFRKLLLRKE